MTVEEITKNQKEICEKYKTDWVEAPLEFKIGVSKNLKSGSMPINALRHPQENGTAGWYIWAGEYSEDKEFFDAMHISHLVDQYPELLKYLGLAPGSRFQIDDKGHEDVWFDEKLLTI